MNISKQQVVETIKSRRQLRAVELLEKTRLIRKKITEDSGKWDAVTVLRDIRYAR
jgi:hypothetical protein